jgi:glycerol-3-phosphate dehydrogenase (NAD(P)+)
MACKTVGIIGAGAWGTALAINIARGGHDVVLWSFDGEYMHFDNVKMPKNLTVVTEPSKLSKTDIWLNVTPASFFRATMRKFVKFYAKQPIIICTKGADSKTHEFMSEILQSELPNCVDFGVLSGPQFATEVANGAPTGSTLAGTARVIKAGRAVLNLTHLDETRDIIGTQISGVGKNVIALISGFISVKIPSENERALIFTQCCNEIIKIGLAMGAKLETFTGLCGLGDLFLSATSKTSRNYSGGVAIATNQELTGTVEGIFAYKTVLHRAKKLGVTIPVLTKIHKQLKNA